MKVVIIGNGAAGNEAAETIRKSNTSADIVMISHELYPEYSACALPDCIAGFIPRSKLFLKDYKDYEQQRIEINFGQLVTAIDICNKQVVLDRTRIEYDKLILALGSKALIPPIKGFNLSGNFVLKSVSDVDNIIKHKPSQVVVVGSGNIGVEAAEALKMQKCNVTLIELMDRIMPKVFDEKSSSRMQRILEKNDIGVFTGEKLLAVNGTNQVEGVVTDKRIIPCDTVIWAAGVRQNVELACKAGIEIGQLGGIKVNSRMETSHKDIYACGDCIESFDYVTGKPVLSLLWSSAKRQAQTAALNCMGKTTEYEGSINVVVEEIFKTLCVSIGSSADMLSGDDVQVIEQDYENYYYKVLLVNDRIAGWQSIGVNEGIGAIMALIRNRIPLREVRKVWGNGDLIRRVPWYLEAGRFLFAV